MKPVISIIVPVFNVAPYLNKCIGSILAQTFTDYELILVNDGSTDNGGAICDEYAGTDKRVKVIHKAYGGVSSARNAGVQAAQGDFIGFVDGDDYIDKEMYQVLNQLCKRTGSDISICKLSREIDGELMNKGEENFIVEMDHIGAMRELFKGVLYRFSLCNKLFAKKCFEKVKFPEGRIHEDLSTTYKLFANANRAVYTNRIGYVYVKRKKSILTSKYHEKRLDAFTGWDEILSFMRREYIQMLDEVGACFAYWCIDNIHYVLNQIERREERKKYLLSIRKCIKKYNYITRRSDRLTLKDKTTLLLFSYSFFIFFLVKKLKG